MKDMMAPHLERVRAALADKDGMTRTKLEANLDVDTEEHFRYQETQAWAHASGIISQADAQIVYAALGEVYSASNGGWAAGTDLATKVAVTQLIGELLEAKITAMAGGR